MSSLRIVADENIPCVDETFGGLGRIDRFPGRKINAEALKDADVLLIRSVTSVEPPLLDESPVRFVGSATIGTDHIDEQYLDDRGVTFAHAPASNADSVADYVIAALLVLARHKSTPLRNQTVGIVGCGNIGGRLAARLPALGLSVMLNDPPREDKGGDSSHSFVPLDRVLAESDIVTLHVPLTREGPHATRHLINERTLEKLQPHAWLLNTSRGAVVNGVALRRALEDDSVGAAVLDVWENEPTPDEELLRAVDVATPHIAGYAFDGKVRGTKMLYEALCKHLDVPRTWNADEVLRPPHRDALRIRPPDPRLARTDWLHHVVSQAYNLQADDERLRKVLDYPPNEQGSYFSHLRSTYPVRREFQQYGIRRSGVPSKYYTAVEQGITAKLC